ncbi:MAG: TlpA family protein disulfide reductase [Thermoguttaceae bacterium]
MRQLFILLVLCVALCSAKIQMATETDSSDASAKNISGDAVKKIDLAKQPWLVESARIPEGMATTEKSRMLWAKSAMFEKISDVVGGPIEVERWINEPPKDIAGKFVLIEVWATWCPPCRRNLPLLEYFHEKYQDDLVVISICETDEDALKKMEGNFKLENIKSPLAVDTHRRFANSLGVYGIPHAVLIEPIFGAVLWEGMPTQIGYELSDEVLGKILANRAKLAAAGKLPEKSPISFKACPPDPNKPNERPRTTSYGMSDEPPCNK